MPFCSKRPVERHATLYRTCDTIPQDGMVTLIQVNKNALTYDALISVNNLHRIAVVPSQIASGRQLAIRWNRTGIETANDERNVKVRQDY